MKKQTTKKRVLSLLLSLLTIMSAYVGIGSVNASAVSADLGYNIGDIKFTLSNGTYHEGWYVKTVNGTIAHCVEPGKPMGGDYSSALATDNNALKMSLADYFGRHLKTGATLNTADAAFNAFYTQLYVWEVLGVSPTSITDWGGNATGKYALASYNTWKSEVQGKIDAYLKTVSFAGQTVTMKVGETKNLTDTAGAFSNYTVLSNTSGTTVSKTGNTLAITANATSKDGVIKYQWYIDPTYRGPSYYWNSDTGDQKLMTPGISVPKEISINVTVEKNGNLKLVKELLGTDIINENSCYGPVTEAEFSLYDKDKKILQSGIKVNASGEYLFTDMTPGAYYIQETKAPKGFALDNTLYPVTVSAGTTNTKTIKNFPQNDPVGILLKKLDAVTDNIAQGGAGLANAEFTAKYYDNFFSSENELIGKTPVRTWVLKTDNDGYTSLSAQSLVSGDPFYTNSLGFVTLPLGTLTVQETKAPSGYKINNDIFIRQITSDGPAETVSTYNAPEIPDEVLRAGVQVQKLDADFISGSQGDATLAGTVIEIVNLNENPVYVNGATYAKNAVCATLTTDATGLAQSSVDLLPPGRYRADEVTPPSGYLNAGSGLSQEFEITSADADKLVLLSAPMRNNIIRGGVQIEKWDNEINANQAQGGATLENTEINLYNISTNAVVVDGITYQPGELITMLVTGNDGKVATANNYLPCGTYRAAEKSAPQGYLSSGSGLEQTFEIRNSGEMVVLTGGQAIKNNPIRGDLKGLKIADGGVTHDRLANVPFRLTLKATGENHIIVTDGNGALNSEGTWNPHTQNTNRGETSEDGIWFGDISAIVDNLGALLYGEYLVEELPCEANEGLELIAPFTVSIYRNGVTVDLGTMTDPIPPVPAIGTSAYEQKTGLSDIQAVGNVTIVDKVTYENLTAGQEYLLKGILMDKATGEPLVIAGVEITAEYPFTPTSSMGVVRNLFTLDASSLIGKSVVVFEYLYLNGAEVVNHTDINDEGQTVNFYGTPKIGTTAVEQDTGNKEILPAKSITIVDTVTYEGLTPGKEYLVSGLLMDKATNAPLLINGEQVVVETPFTPTSSTGSVAIPFTFNGLSLAGKEIVVFETVYLDGIDVAVHADINDKGQTIRIQEPKISTKAAEQDTGNKEIMPGETVTLVDTVTYQDLTPGKLYKLQAILMNKHSNTPVLVDGNELVSSAEFTPAEATGTQEVTFTFNASTLAGKSVVVFETLTMDGIEVAVHADINDEGQTVRFYNPEIGTKAAEKGTGDKEILPGQEVTILDTVSYTDLIPGKEYVLNGILMDKATNKPMLVDGKELISSVKFIPTEATGSQEVPFTFNASTLAGKSVVVFETLSMDEIEVAVHADINDEGQTVRIREPKIGTKASEKNTGSKQIQPKKNVTIVDTVSYTDLAPGKTYVLKGILMDKATNKPLLVDGKEISKEMKVTPKETSGSFEMSFTFDGSALASKSVVVFETLYLDEKEVAVHADINDAGQTVTFTTPPTPGKPTTTVPDTGDYSPAATVMVVLAIALMGGIATVAILLQKKRKKAMDGSRNEP